MSGKKEQVERIIAYECTLSDILPEADKDLVFLHENWVVGSPISTLCIRALQYTCGPSYNYIYPKRICNSTYTITFFFAHILMIFLTDTKPIFRMKNNQV